MKRLVTIILSAAFIFILASSASAFYMDFEEGLGYDQTYIVGVPGVTFTNAGGEQWKYGDSTTGLYNVTSVDLGLSYGTGRYNLYGNVFAWTGIAGDTGRIDFDDTNGTWFQIGVSAADDFFLEAYDEFDTLIASDSILGGSTQWEAYTDLAYLRVDAPAGSTIAYVIVHDTGNYWLLDNMTGDMAGGVPTPEPSTLLLLGFGILGLAGIRRKS